jgi:hypothetical protein
MFGKPFLLSITLLLATTANANSWYNKRIGSTLLYDKFMAAGVPAEAIQRTFEFLDVNEKKSFHVKLGEKIITKTVSNENYAVIIDYSKPSSERRLFLLNLETGTTEKYFVAHGVRTGNDRAIKFSNKQDSRQTSLGLFLTGSAYEGSHGESLYLHGLEDSNSNAFNRDIVMHGAQYVSAEFLEKYGRMGRSWGCPAVSKPIMKKILPLIKDGAVLYAYHKDLMPVAQASPTIQEVSKDQQSAADHNNNVVPEEINP